MDENQIKEIVRWALGADDDYWQVMKELDAEIDELMKRVQPIIDARDLRITSEVVES